MRIGLGGCLGVLIVEASHKSGALITARLANDYNREVFALPGRIDQPITSAGTNGLIRDGVAKLVISLQDILDGLGEVGQTVLEGLKQNFKAGGLGTETQSPVIGRLGDEEQKLLAAIGSEPVSTDALCATCELEASRVTATLTGLQLKGLVKQLPGQRFVRRA